MIPLIPVHISKIGGKGFGSLCFSLSRVPKKNLAKELYAFMEQEFLKKLEDGRTKRNFEQNG
jgi:hypothetical protein